MYSMNVCVLCMLNDYDEMRRMMWGGRWGGCSILLLVFGRNERKDGNSGAEDHLYHDPEVFWVELHKRGWGDGIWDDVKCATPTNSSEAKRWQNFLSLVSCCLSFYPPLPFFLLCVVEYKILPLFLSPHSSWTFMSLLVDWCYLCCRRSDDPDPFWCSIMKIMMKLYTLKFLQELFDDYFLQFLLLPNPYPRVTHRSRKCMFVNVSVVLSGMIRLLSGYSFLRIILTMIMSYVRMDGWMDACHTRSNFTTVLQ